MFCAVDVHEQLPLQHIEGLVRFGVHVQRGRLALRLQDLEQQKRASRVRARSLEGQQSAVKPVARPRGSRHVEAEVNTGLRSGRDRS
jgi:hypothetical protein